MAHINVNIKISFAWWWYFYREGVVQFCVITGASPDMDKVTKVMRRAMRTTVSVG